MNSKSAEIKKIAKVIFYDIKVGFCASRVVFYDSKADSCGSKIEYYNAKVA